MLGSAQYRYAKIIMLSTFQDWLYISLSVLTRLYTRTNNWPDVWLGALQNSILRLQLPRRCSDILSRRMHQILAFPYLSRIGCGYRLWDDLWSGVGCYIPLVPKTTGDRSWTDSIWLKYWGYCISHRGRPTYHKSWVSTTYCFTGYKIGI